MKSLKEKDAQGLIQFPLEVNAGFSMGLPHYNVTQWFIIGRRYLNLS